MSIIHNSQGAIGLMNGLRKCGICIKWNFIQPQRRMKFYHLQVNGWKGKTSSSTKLARYRRSKAACVLSYVEYRPHMRENRSH
jgi:hypothetical protein